MEYGMTIETRDPAGTIISHRGQSFSERLKSSGTGRYVFREVTDVDGDETSTTYDETHRPLEIVRNGESSSFRYDAQGRVTYKSDPRGVQQLEYGDAGKVTKVRLQTRAGGVRVDKLTVLYRYDARANLVEAVQSDGLAVVLTYDSQGRISTLRMNGGPSAKGPREMAFRYNAEGRPVKISVHGVGELSVAYAANGEIDKVDSTGGADVSMQITTMYQSLLDVVAPAGVKF
jgi:YD repeat-containing protein